ncbi:unnamed protein product [Rhizoctonia solani]|uniref:Uncharacterized protein n=1 Tax=Rhizoctonia solani TaxID=456999 RepID=A0A8H3CUE9_9AGAM|nr:unnamed protein product [Rhizoctonia solani]
MPRPSKGTRASRENLLKAREKRTILRSLRTTSGSGDVTQGVKTNESVYNVCLNSTAVENDDQARTALRNDYEVAVSTNPRPELNNTGEVDSVPQLPNEGGAVAEQKKAHLEEGSLCCDESTSQLVDQGVVPEAPLVRRNVPIDRKDELKLILDPTPKDGVRQQAVSNEKTEALQTSEKMGKSYLKMCKENYRASKKIKLATPTSNEGLERVEIVLSEGSRIAMVGI